MLIQINDKENKFSKSDRLLRNKTVITFESVLEIHPANIGFVIVSFSFSDPLRNNWNMDSDKPKCIIRKA